MVGKSDKNEEGRQAAKGVLARWRDTYLTAKGWGPVDWVKATGGVMDVATVRRNMDEDRPSTTKIENLHALARAAQIPSVLDFLEGQIANPPTGVATPTPADIKIALAFAMRVAPDDRKRLNELEVLAHGVAAGLRRLARSPATKGSQGYLEAVEQDVLDAIASVRR